MTYFLLGLILLILLASLIFKKNDEKILAEIRRNWGRAIERYRNIDLIEKYPENKDEDHFHQLTSQTLKDIDIENLFSVLDRNLTTIGQQTLYHKIVFPTNDLKNLIEADKKSSYFISEVAKREAVQLILSRLENNGTTEIADLLNYGNAGIDKNLRLYQLLTASAFAGVIASVFFPVVFIYLIPLLGTNIMIQYVFKYRNESQYQCLREIYGLIKAAQKLQKTDTIIEGASIGESIRSLKPFVKNYSLLNFGIPADDLTKALFYFLELLKACFLLELHLLRNSYSQISRHHHSLKVLYQYIADFDFSISTASLKSDRSWQTCTPELTAEAKILEFTNAIHPLVDHCVANSFSLNKKSAFITGSNMSGKSTFLRVILINSILAQTLYLCFAESYTSSFLKPYSSIRIDDDLLSGSSYFFMEAEIIKKMTEQVSLSANHLFVIDETFKGTNTLERISLAKAVLDYLNHNDNLVIASSHDLELINLLSKDFERFYFTETIRANSLNFDHTIKPGALKTTNAIKIIEIEGYPTSVIEEAYRMTRQYRSGTFLDSEESTRSTSGTDSLNSQGPPPGSPAASTPR